MANVAEILDMRQPDKVMEASGKLFSTSRIGVEIEVEKVPDEVWGGGGKYWNVVRDGSLRAGCEFVFIKPLGGIEVEKAMSFFSDFVKAYPNHMDVNDRTGLHVHVDVRDLRPKQVEVFILLAAMFEEVLMAKTGDRKNNIYCCRFATCDEQLITAHKIGGLGEGNNNRVFAMARKYASVNLLSVIEKGSVEFRYHRGCLDTEEILVWINTLLRMKSFAEVSTVMPQDLPNLYSVNGGLELFREVMGEELLQHYADENSEKYLFEGMRLVQDALLLSDMQDKESDMIEDSEKGLWQGKNSLLRKFYKKQGWDYEAREEEEGEEPALRRVREDRGAEALERLQAQAAEAVNRPVVPAPRPEVNDEPWDE